MIDHVYDVRREALVLDETMARRSGLFSKILDRLDGQLESPLEPTRFTNLDPVDRSEFVVSSSDLMKKLAMSSVMIVGSNHYADGKLNIDSGVPIPNEGEALLYSSEAALADDLRATRSAAHSLRMALEDARTRMLIKAIKEAWWWKFDDERHYEANPFRRDPTEQIVLKFGDDKEFTTYNFGEKLPADRIQQLARAVSHVAQITNGAIVDLVPNLVIHNDFQPRHFKRSNATKKPGGQAWSGEPWIELSTKVGSRPKGSRGQTYFEQCIVHELHHQIDAHIDPREGVFKDYFMYIDDDKDGLIDRTFPLSEKERWAYAHNNQRTNGSQPHRDYGLTNPKEDLAVTSEESVYGGKVDKYRREAHIEELTRFVAKYTGVDAANATIAYPLDTPNYIAIETRQGSDIQLPQLSVAQRPIRLKISNNSPLIPWLISSVRRRVLASF